MSPPLLNHLFRTTPTLAQITNRAIVSVIGSQSSEFLNGLLSTSVQNPPKNQYSTLLHAQGKVMYDVFLYSTKAGYLLEFDSRPSEAPPLLSYLKRHVLRSKVKICNVTDEYDIWAAWGAPKDSSWETVRKWEWAPSGSGAVEPSWNDSKELWPWGADENVINDRRAVGMGRRLLVRKGERPRDLSSHDVGSIDDYHLHRILHGVPEGIIDIPPMHAFPMESNLDAMGGLDFRKGCYVGQELTVRTYHRGVVRKRILPIYLDRPNQTISDRLAFPDNADIKPTFDAEKAVPRPRGLGKLLSTQKEVGLSLLRLEHVAGVQRGEIKLELEIPVEGDQLIPHTVIPFWPDWWPDGLPNKDHSMDSI